MKRTFSSYNMNGPIKTSNTFAKKYGGPAKFRKIANKNFSKTNVQQQLIGGTTSMKEIKCRDQIFTPGVMIDTTLEAAVAYIEPSVAGLGLATGYTCINCTAQGSGVSMRVGNKIVIKSLRITGTITKGEGATVADDGMVRVLVVYDKQTNGAAPSVSTIISNIGTGGASATAFNSPININYKNRFVTLRDQYVKIGYHTDCIYNIDMYIKKKMEVVYKATNAVPLVTDIASGAIYLLIFTETGDYDIKPTINNINVRMRYED